MAYRTAVASDLTGYGHGEGVLQTTNRRARHSGRRKPQWHENPSTFGRAGSIPASGTNHPAAARHPWPLPLHRIGVMPLRCMPSWWAYSPSHIKLAAVGLSATFRCVREDAAPHGATAHPSAPPTPYPACAGGPSPAGGCGRPGTSPGHRQSLPAGRAPAGCPCRRPPCRTSG